MRYLLCLALLVLLPLTEGQAATAPGFAVFVKVVSAADDARSDVYEQRLDGGRARLLVSHTALPKSFRGRVEVALPSPDGALLALKESDGVFLRNKRTGATRLMPLGGSYLAAEKVGDYVGGYWLWRRGTGAVKRIWLVGSQEALTGLGCSLKLMDWSPRGKRLLVHVFTTDKRKTEYLRVFDAATGRTHTLLTTRHDVLFAHWTSDGAAVLVGEKASGKTCRLELVSLTGKTQRLFIRPLRVWDVWYSATSPFDAALSPDGRQVAVGESSGYYLFSRDGRTRRRLALPEMDDDAWPLGDMAFSPDGRTLAVLVSFGRGTGEGRRLDEEIWTVHSETAKAQWHLALRSSADFDAVHVLLGWVPGQPALLLASRNYSGIGSGPESQSRELWLQPIAPGQAARLLIDTGPRGIDISWRGEPSTLAHGVQRGQVKRG